MSAADTRKLSFILQGRTQSAVAEELGIPRSTLGSIVRTGRELPSEYTQDLRNLYQREAYARARATGFSADQARRFSWYSPETVATTIAEYHGKVLELTTYAVGRRLERLSEEGEDITQDVIDSVFADSYNGIVEGLRKSKAPIEDIIEWGSP